MCDDEKANGSELGEEQLQNVSGGGATQNRYDPSECSKINGPCDRCDGKWNWNMWCDYYRKEVVEQEGINKDIRHTCVMGRYDVVINTAPTPR